MIAQTATNYFAKNLIFLCKKLRVTQEQLALQVDKRQSTIGNWKNKVSSPDVEDLIRISQFFDISLDDLVLKDLEHVHLFESDAGKKIEDKVHQSLHLSVHQTTKKPVNYTTENHIISTVNEGQETLLWSVMNVLKQMDGKLDLLLTPSYNNKKKNP